MPTSCKLSREEIIIRFIRPCQCGVKTISTGVCSQESLTSSNKRKAGQTNVGSGTTPTVVANPSDSTKKLVVITDNAYPQMNVVVYDYSTGAKVSETPVFSKMRSSNEASATKLPLSDRSTWLMSPVWPNPS